MDWTKIPTTLISKRYSDYEIASIVKFQLIWAMNEEKPDKKTALRYMTGKQYDTAVTYIDSISARVNDDVSSVVKKRNAEKIRYSKNKDLGKNLQPDCTQTANSLPEQIREDKIREDKSAIKYRYCGKVIKLNERDYNLWKEKYKNVDLDYELDSIDNWFMQEKNKSKRPDWFWMTPNMLAKKNKELNKGVFNGR